MRIAGNRLFHLRDFFSRELEGIYPQSEIDFQFRLAAEKYLGINSSQLKGRLNDNINQSELLKLYDCAKDLKKHIPLQYILREAWFYDLPFYVDSSVLIPRPETEELVEIILKDHPELQSALDIGTGSGCIPVTLKKNRKEAMVHACDISEKALAVAKKNSERQKTEVKFFEADILDEKAAEKFQDSYKVVVSNPPYIKESEKELMSPHVKDHEPGIALFVSGQDPVIFYKRIIDLCSRLLQPGGSLYFELNPLTAQEVKEYAEKSVIFTRVELLRDMSGKTRFLSVVKKD